jgi:N4-bis(aminopropyl)spermidine synthase
MSPDIDLRAAVNAISDVIMNRPRPLREFDQIHMKAGDMVMQAEFVARWADGERLAFIGDGDSISVCVAYLQARGILTYGPAEVEVFDFDERVVSAVNRFADHERLDRLHGTLYNCLDPMPGARQAFERFYTNPPWGASNGGASVNLFALRGMEAIGFSGEGMIVIADDALPWAQKVLSNCQNFAIGHGFFVKRMTPGLHSYHLDDDPDLRSCNLVIKSLPENAERAPSEPLTDAAILANFYGAGKEPRVRYVREKKRLNYGKAHDDEYEFEYLEGEPNGD